MYKRYGHRNSLFYLCKTPCYALIMCFIRFFKVVLNNTIYKIVPLNWYFYDKEVLYDIEINCFLTYPSQLVGKLISFCSQRQLTKLCNLYRLQTSAFIIKFFTKVFRYTTFHWVLKSALRGLIFSRGVWTVSENFVFYFET